MVARKVAETCMRQIGEMNPKKV